MCTSLYDKLRKAESIAHTLTNVLRIKNLYTESLKMSTTLPSSNVLKEPETIIYKDDSHHQGISRATLGLCEDCQLNV